MSVLFALGLLGVFSLGLITVWLNSDCTKAIVYSGWHLSWYEGTSGVAVTVSLGLEHKFPPGFSIVSKPDFEVNEPPFVGTVERWSRVRESSVSIGLLSFLAWLPATGALYIFSARKERQRLAANPMCGACHECSYDLEGNESGRCPECGTSIRSIEISGVCSRCNAEFPASLASSHLSETRCVRCAAPLVNLTRRNNMEIRNERVARASLLIASTAMFPGTSMPFVGLVMSIAAFAAGLLGRSRIARSPKRYGGWEFVRASLPLSAGAAVLSSCRTALCLML